MAATALYSIALYCAGTALYCDELCAAVQYCGDACALSFVVVARSP
jgi:hypothetical protein